jgi:hypothetical protein
MPNADQVAALRRMVWADVGMSVPLVLTFSPSLIELGTIEVDVRYCGALSPLLNTAVVNVQMGVTKNDVIVLKYSYLLSFVDRHGDSEHVVTKHIHPNGEVEQL